MGIIELDKKWAVEDARKEARQEGRLAGRKEGQRAGRKESARNLLQLGVDIDIIEKATELSREEILRLQLQ